MKHKQTHNETEALCYECAQWVQVSEGVTENIVCPCGNCNSTEERIFCKDCYDKVVVKCTVCKRSVHKDDTVFSVCKNCVKNNPKVIVWRDGTTTQK
jgi:hypothetical protein